jgi:serine/threonine protein kinase/tetratricopeptide (TPR) repeat protein
MSQPQSQPSASHPHTPTWVLDLLDRFEAAWQRGPWPDVEQLLPAEANERRAALVPLLCCDLERRLRPVQSLRVEDYQRRFPELAQDEAGLCELVALEYELLRSRPVVKFADYLQRFPQLENRLRQRFPSGEQPTPPGSLASHSTVPPGGNAAPDSQTLPPLRYKAVQFHAQGALGEVLVAQDEEMNRSVALKRIKEQYADDAASRRRFMREAEVTGRLEHPGVVPVYGMGQDADGRPCYAMRFIQGESLKEAIARFHAAEKPARDPGERSLALRQLLTSFVTVCKTMAYAHSRGVLHRDLKPANIMLGKYGETLVVDWGLARHFERDEAARSLGEETLQPRPAGSDGETQQGQIVGTPAYCSPEQASGQWDIVGPTSDIFSLGVVLYNLLTNGVPYRGPGGIELIAQARRGDVIPPRQRNHEVPRPLEAICLKAMAKQPQQRYGTALELAADVEHWLADEPVKACREPAPVRVGRWLRKHRSLVAGMAAAAAVALVSLMVVLVVVAGKNRELQLANQREAARAEAEPLAKEQAQRRLEQIAKGTDILGSIFADLDPHAEEKEGKPLREILGKRVERVADQLAGESIADALTVAKLQKILGESLVGLGRYAAGGVLLKKSAATRAAELGDDHPDALGCRNCLAVAYQADGKLELAMPLFESTLKACEAKLGEDHPTTVTSRSNLATAYHDAGKLELAIPLFQRTPTIQEAKLGDDDPGTLASRHNLAATYLAAGQLELAIPLFQRTVQARGAKLGDDHSDTLNSCNSLAVAFGKAGKLDLAIPLLERTLKGRQTKLGDDHPDTLMTRNNLAMAYKEAGQLDLAIPLFQRTLQAREVKLGDDHPSCLLSRNNLAMAHMEAGQLDLAIRQFEKLVPLAQKKLGVAHPLTMQWSNNWLAALGADRQFARAIRAGKDLLVIQRKAFGSDDARLASTLAQLGSNMLAAQQQLEAEPMLRESLAIRAKKEPEAWTTFNTQSVLGAALLGQKKYADAEPLLMRGYEGMKQRQAKVPPHRKVWLTEALQRLVQLYDAVGKKDEAAKWRKQLNAAKATSKKP